jgi:hypothetical protein
MTGIGGDAHSLAQFGRQRRLATSAGLCAMRQRHRSGPIGVDQLPPLPGQRR